MAVGGLVAVGVADADVLAVAAFPAGLLDHAVAGGEDRRAHARAPSRRRCACVTVAEDRMIARAEARPHDSVRQRLAHQELLRALAGLVVVVDDVVVGRLVAIELAGLAAGGERGEQHFGLAAVADVLVLAGEQHFERIARAGPCAGNRRRTNRSG